MVDKEFDINRFPMLKICIDAWTHFFDNPNEISPENIKELEVRLINWLSKNKLEFNKKTVRDIRLIITPDRMRRRKLIYLKGDKS
jgi:hypothetical protein